LTRSTNPPLPKPFSCIISSTSGLANTATCGTNALSIKFLGSSFPVGALTPPAPTLPLGENVPPAPFAAPPGENTLAASAIGVFEPELQFEPGSDDVEAKRFEMLVFARRNGKEAIEAVGDVARCRESV
jgi:hypothetical protein